MFSVIGLHVCAATQSPIEESSEYAAFRRVNCDGTLAAFDRVQGTPGTELFV
jgi:hypothetical protein